MRLLDKISVVQQKNLERKREIDEGVKLAKKVDAVREKALDEEKKLFLFRDQAFSQIKKELTELTDRRDVLAREVDSLDAKRQGLMIPLDAEWEKVRQKARDIEVKEEEIAVKISEFLSEQRNQEETLKSIAIEEKRVQNLKSEANLELIAAAEARNEAQILLSAALETSEKIIASANEREKEVNSKELQIAARERDIMNLKESLDRREQLLDAQEVLIKDRYDTLLRTQKRLHG